MLGFKLNNVSKRVPWNDDCTPHSIDKRFWLNFTLICTQMTRHTSSKLCLRDFEGEWGRPQCVKRHHLIRLNVCFEVIILTSAGLYSRRPCIALQKKGHAHKHTRTHTHVCIYIYIYIRISEYQNILFSYWPNFLVENSALLIEPYYAQINYHRIMIVLATSLIQMIFCESVIRKYC